MREIVKNYVRDGLTIRGFIYLPDEEKAKYPTIICAHGFNGTPGKHRRYAERFCAEGYVTVTFDFCGGGERLSSDGDCLDMSIMTELADLEVVFDTVSALDFVDSENIMLFGESMGGAVVALMAAKYPEKIKRLLMLYPGLMLPDKFRSIYPDRTMIPDKVFHFAMDVGRRYFEDVYDLDMWAEIVKYTGEVYILHGDKDEAVPIETSYKARELYANCRFDVLPGYGHGLFGEKQMVVADKLLAYLREKTNA